MRSSLLIAMLVLLVPALFLPEAWAADQDDPARRVLVRYRETQDYKANALIIRSGGKLEKRFRHLRTDSIELPADQDRSAFLEALRRDPAVLIAEPNREVTYLAMPELFPDDPLFTDGMQWHLDTTAWEDVHGSHLGTTFVDTDMDAPAAWAVLSALLSSNDRVGVGVIDSGCGQSGFFSPSVGYIPNHPDLPNSSLWANTAEPAIVGTDDDLNGYIDDVNGWDYRDDDNAPADPTRIQAPYHGTQIAGVIGAAWGNSEGVAGAGMGHLSVLPLRAQFLDEILAAIDYAIGFSAGDEPIRVLNASWQLLGGSSLLRSAIEDAGSAGIVIVAAAGNSGNDNDDSLSRVYPAEYFKEGVTNILAVAATDPDGSLASFSNYGSQSVQVAAPGRSIHTTSGDEDIYESVNGTSFATPLAASAAGLVLAVNPALSPEQAIDRVINGGDYDMRLDGLTVAGKRVNLSGAVAPFSPYSGLLPLGAGSQAVMLYTDTASALYGSITSAVSSSPSVAVMVTTGGASWAVSPVSAGIVDFTLTFSGGAAPVGTYQTGPWRVSAMTPLTATVGTGSMAAEPFVSLAGTGTASWTVKDPELASIDADGNLTGICPGETRVVLWIDGVPADISGPVTVVGMEECDDGSGGGGGGGCGTVEPPTGGPQSGFLAFILTALVLLALRSSYMWRVRTSS
jgi:hypothetical protein